MANIPSNNHKTDGLLNSRENLQRLLGQIVEYPDRRAEITEIIENTFGDNKAVLVLDMSGFSRTTQQFGIISFLLMIHQMRSICEPCIQQNGGILVKAEADNLFCLFDQVVDAVTASQEMSACLKAANAVLPTERHLYASFGIGYGRILNIADEDIFGNEVNLASKLGEDIAGQDEILLSSSARAELAESEINTREENASISGILLTYYKVEQLSAFI
ncbi:adenylate/guanylate cyclase domain-containing protein [Leptolyngbya ohadii]|uniref:adenylate/guanylate cyclase domain-containing protein n=1 Tax=Leptolyngbya ohadii TaxID=1962290 RepID=UPI000B59EF38|nr:adenylate/guanylate cyclase domain-containing protein [Leptolyngbya ohadii]